MKIKQSGLNKQDWKVIFMAMRMIGVASAAILDELIYARKCCNAGRI